MVEDLVATEGAPGGFLARQLLAIIAADVVGYARLTEVDEEGTHSRLRSARVGIIDPCVVSYRGRIIKNTGDGFLASFDSPLDAVNCAVELQHEIAVAESRQPEDRRIQFRIGINLGHTIVETDDVYGVGVNIAARLQERAPPGGILVSEDVIDRVGSRLDVRSEDLGALRLKNMSRPVRGFSLLIPGIDRAAAKRSRPQGRAKVPSIAVLPFRTHGQHPEDDYFGGGIVEDIIVALQSIRGLLVISRTSTLAYREASVDTGKVGQELGVRYVLSGSVRRADQRLRITAELCDVEAGAVIWADRYDGDLSELFEFQNRIATRMVWSVTPRVREAELKRALRKRPNNMNAYDLVMQAIDLMYRMSFQDFSRAGELLQGAIAADENYATAYAYAALWHIHNVTQGWGTDGDVDSAEAVRLAAAAVDRDPADGFALAIYGHTKSLLFRDYAAAENMFEHALSASPSNAMAWTLSSGVYAYRGNGKCAVARAEQGLRLSPADAQAHFYLSFLGLAHYMNGAFEEAVIWARKAAVLNPRLCANLRTLSASLVSLGQIDDARQVATMLLQSQPRFRVSVYSERCPFEPPLCERFVDQLRQAGLPR